MGRTSIPIFPGASAASLGIADDLAIPPQIAPSLYAGYIFNSQFGHNPLEDISDNGRDATNVGVDFSHGDFPLLSPKKYLLLPFSANDFMNGSEGSMLVVVKAAPGVNHVIMHGLEVVGSALNNLPDTHAPVLYINSADKVVAQMNAGGFFSNTSPTADSGATDFHIIGWSFREGDGVGTFGSIRSYRRRLGQPSIYGATAIIASVDPGNNMLCIGYDSLFAANTNQVAGAFLFSAQKDQAAFDAAADGIATLMNPFLASAGGAL